ncbi:MAG: UvrD-helicase domain-containing protein [Candidatus Margulisbacteria bacterium]|jgi:ATP-dependent exoDNAse (exonuclease V) beta subunit|nr:UvrD-helicase domain-containing protein [Candidatus Margulisiibacteriota bacterium]
MNTAQQKIVKARGQSICVNASAGTGKTTVLVERILSLIRDDQISICKILAITYTDKAAQELKERLTQAMRDSGLNYWETETAYITTFHSFCARILRENCFQLNLPPDFRILTDIPAKLLLEEATNKVIDNRLKNDDPKICGLLEKYPRANLLNGLAAALAAMQAAGQTPKDLQVTPAEILKNITGLNEKYLRECYAEIQSKARRLASLQADKAGAENLRAVLIKICAEDFAQDRLKEIQGLFAGRKIKEDTAAGEFLRAIRVRIAGLKYFLDCSAELKFCELTAEYLDLLEEARAEYSRLKEKNNLLDFEDLQLKTLKMLKEQPGIASFYQKHFAEIAVDEFQDTNGLQNELLNQLAEKNNLFIVGDRKQSIYFFRHADSALFAKRGEAIAQAGGLRENLTENYRCAQNIIGLVNQVCANLLPDYAPEKLRAGREEQLASPGEAKIVFIPQHKNLNENTEAARGKEARYIARQLKDLQGQDNAILLPKTTGLKIYTAALEAENLPYTVWSGGTYYQRGEIIDVLNFLQILNNPYDDLKLAAVLRSEMFSVSDGALFMLTRDKKEKPLFALLERGFAGWPAEDREKIEDFRRIYAEIAACLGKLPVARIVKQVLEKTFFTRVAFTHRDKSAQISANLQKLLEIAQDPLFSRHNLAYFIHYIEKLQEEGAKETDAEPEDKTNAIKILTIHKAKGLEFDNVFIADIYAHSTEKTSDNPFNKQLAEQKIPLALQYKEDGEDYISLAARHSKRLNLALETAERKRLFYVALTRAKKRLYVISAYPQNSDQEEIKDISCGCLDTQNIGAWLRYLCQQNKISAQYVVNDPAIPPETKKKTSVKLPTILPEPGKYLPELQETYELNNLTATLAGDLLKQTGAFILNYFHGFPLPAPQTHGRFDAETMLKIGRAAHKAIEEKTLKYTGREFTPAQKEFLQKCLDNFYASEAARLMRANAYYLELDLDYLENNIRYQGRADLVIQTTGAVLVYDFKTGEAEQKYNAQVALYMAILQKYFAGKKIQGFIFYLHSNNLAEVALDENIFQKCADALATYENTQT